MPAPTSSHTKALRGTARADRQKPAGAAERLTAVPKAPPTVSDAAKAEWQRLAPILVNAGTLTANDLRALELLAETLASAAAFAAVIAKDGTLIEGAGGTRKAHPALQALATARAQARALLHDFGLTPRGRAAVEQAPAAPTAADDPYAEFG